ncbi:type VI secretion system ATPase TssH [Caldimonas caldifontis]|uniref:Type VI secretion system ATPase TssH n=1 Tax=Caldimonas caldifontis TaxID=1452508 RepID=A0A2S5SY49_9BURK|nr:type VI secretion system ATPase TssH [Caldimonas caldifontis]PPE67694.1 type VI secretion system ATPase TssH [Caldimonas caldifontis]
MSASLKTLITKLNDVTRQAAERAASLCMSHGHHEVDIEHVLLALLDEPRSDLVLLCDRCEVSPSRLRRDLQSALARLPSGNTRTPVFSQRLPLWLEHAWLIASLDNHAARIRSAHLLLALITDPGLSQMAARASAALLEFPAHELKHRLDSLTDGSAEASTGLDLTAGASVPPLQIAPGDSSASTPALDRYTTNLTQRARDGAIDPVVGREAEIRQVIDILLRRRQNNPILTGEAGVGKTAVVEGLALRIAADDVPEPLRGVAVHVLDLGLLQAGASVKGEFENRLQQVIDEVKRSLHPIVLFIDEAHTMIGAGGQAGQNDAANLLKPALARGELRTVAATTWGEYKKYFEKDAALARRFQVVKVEEPSEPVAADMLRAMVPLMERHFKVRICDEAIVEAVRLSHRYINGRQLPDKAVGVLDTACARVALGRRATPAVIEEGRRRLSALEAERQALTKEAASGSDHRTRLAELDTEVRSVQSTLEADLVRWAREQDLAAEIESLRERLEQGGDGDEAPVSEGASAASPSKARKKGEQALRLSPWQAALQAKLAELAAIQGESPLVPVQVDAQAVAQVVAAWTGVPLGKMVKDDIQAVLQLQETLESRVIGQPHALAAVAQCVRTARAQLEDPNKPQGVFLFVGPSGVGKTETALALAEALYGGERSLVTINMSEYQEAHSVSGLKGSPPGYVGYGEGGVLTEAVRRKPYSVVLLDEVEKAHPDVLELFYQVFDKGVMEDAEGREIDFRNTLIILTSNVGSSTLMQACLNKTGDDLPSPEALEELLRPQLYKAFKPAFLGRLKVVPYRPLSDDVLERVIRLKLDRVGERFQTNHNASFEYDDALVEAVLARCTEVDTGARKVDHLLGSSLLPDLARTVLARMAEGQPIGRVKVGVGKDGQFKYRVS